MKILGLADIHGAFAKAEAIIKKESADLVVIGGDLTTVGSVKEAERAIRQIQTVAARLLCVAGNMDLPQDDELFATLGVSINGRGVEIGETGFFGVSASPFTPLHTPYEIPEEEIGKRIQAGFEQIRHCVVKVFVPHAPPYGSRLDIIHAGFHVGSTAVREFIENEEPDVVICGHIHEARGQDMIGKSRIVNCGTAAHGYYAIVDIGKAIKISNLHFAER